MLFTPTSREKFLHLMPKGGIVAEIGTFKGIFSRQILDVVQPERLHLIDPWVFQNQTDYLSDASNVSDRQHEDNYLHVQQLFAAAIASGQVILHRDFSCEAALRFDDRYFDWIYVDGMHTKEAVAADLKAFLPKMKENGLILGHDYIDHEDFGVIDAVDDFIKATDYEMVAMTADACHTFVLSRTPDDEITNTLTSRIIYNVAGVVEINDFRNRRFVHKGIVFPDGVVRALPSF
ncbi:MAG: hypothetical protein A3G18_11985 [Rhodospirillales bacterium RIFCSPLOWO2_12_FULL_58_28]|nr:MAG: hypothetical protein A3H92_09070 [Rhodospirillales bacterium RIFCSPLOWO2_02_FULL_58_16]OHC78161.1 MAG: hypothetical protein A3G18_11985 [Rhodospirillales bacterium RIFCSPLOWO2_12_FULL_58_28]